MKPGATCPPSAVAAVATRRTRPAPPAPLCALSLLVPRIASEKLPRCEGEHATRAFHRSSSRLTHTGPDYNNISLLRQARRGARAGGRAGGREPGHGRPPAVCTRTSAARPLAAGKLPAAATTWQASVLTRVITATGKEGARRRVCVV